MKCIWTIIVTGAFLCGCTGRGERRLGEAMRDPANGTVQVKEVNGYRFRLSYLPQQEQEEELCFRLNVLLPPDAGRGGHETTQASFGVDTLFHLITGTDTLPPLHAMRIANGNIGGVEYMLIFPKRAFSSDAGVIGFSDRLFSNNYFEFPIRFSAIHKIDSLRSRI